MGLCLRAATGAGVVFTPSRDYRLGVDHETTITCALEAMDCRRLDVAWPGDLLLFRLSQRQQHLAVATGKCTIVHAHAGLGRVVEQPVPADWPAPGVWRLPVRSD